MPANNYYDGTHTAAYQHGPTIIVPLPEIKSATPPRVWRKTMRIRSDLWTPLALDTPGPEDATPFSGFLVGETEPHYLEGRIVEWERTYAEVPSFWRNAESFIHPYQFIQTTDGVVTAIGEIPYSVGSIIHYDYYHTTDPATDIPILRAYRLVQVGSLYYTMGTPPGANDTYIVAEDSNYTRWMGNIWVRSTRYVPKLSFDELQ